MRTNPNDSDDCGEGINLRSVTSSVVQGNSVHHHIGGVLLTDETGPNHDNLVVGNSSSHNRMFGGDCGVTRRLAPMIAVVIGVARPGKATVGRIILVSRRL